MLCNFMIFFFTFFLVSSIAKKKKKKLFHFLIFKFLISHVPRQCCECSWLSIIVVVVLAKHVTV